MARDIRIQSWASKQVQIDKNLIASLTEGESECALYLLTPSEVWLLVTFLEFFGDFAIRWVNFDDQLDIDNLRSQTLKGLINPVACSEDIERIAVALETMAVSIQELNLKIGPDTPTISERLTDIELAVTAIETKLPLSTLFDHIETILNGTGVILGALNVDPSPTPP